MRGQIWRDHKYVAFSANYKCKATLISARGWVFIATSMINIRSYKRSKDIIIPCIFSECHTVILKGSSLLSPHDKIKVSPNMCPNVSTQQTGSRQVLHILLALSTEGYRHQVFFVNYFMPRKLTYIWANWCDTHRYQVSKSILERPGFVGITAGLFVADLLFINHMVAAVTTSIWRVFAFL